MAYTKFGLNLGIFSFKELARYGARYDLARALLDALLVIPEKADDDRRRGLELLEELGAVVPEAERIDLSTPDRIRIMAAATVPRPTH